MVGVGLAGCGVGVGVLVIVGTAWCVTDAIGAGVSVKTTSTKLSSETGKAAAPQAGKKNRIAHAKATNFHTLAVYHKILHACIN